MKISMPYVALGLVLLLAGTWAIGYNAGLRSKQREWDESRERGVALVDALTEKANETRVEVQEKVVYRDRFIETKGEERIVVKEIFVPRDSGVLSGGFRLYHDAAATNTAPDPARIPNAAPTAVTDVADTIEYNYQQCHKAYARVELWQEWYTKNAAWAEQIQKEARR